MKKIKLLLILLFVLSVSIGQVFPQNSAGTVIDYVPAPGQHINIENIGTPYAAQKMVENTSSLVSLGSFGGYIVLKFNQAVVNHPDNPYGIDFTIFGNSFSGSSEPGIVWVMKDFNHNGMPDDTWYEIAGSSHFFQGTVKNYEVTYFKTATRDVLWRDNQGKTGKLIANEFNLQEYYPAPGYFPSYPGDSVSFAGTLLQTAFTKSGTGEIRLKTPRFGYADCHSRIQDIDLSLPDNPYTSVVEGAGGDPVDISWAINTSGDYIELDSIHFVKVVSANLNVTGWLGEVSTDLAWIQAVKTQPQTSGKETLLVYGYHPTKVIMGDSLKFDAFYFQKGRITDEPVTFLALNEKVAVVGPSGVLFPVAPGETQIQFTAKEETEYTSIKVAVPESVQFLTDFSAIYPGDTVELSVEVYDNYSEIISMKPHFSSSNPSSGKIITVEDKSYLVAVQPGEFILTASIDKFHLEKEVEVEVHPSDTKLNVFLSIKTAGENLLPLQPIEVGPADLNLFIENRKHDYGGMEKITLFHALTKGLQKANVPFKFRDDDAAGGNLYLYMVENEGLFSYGWGGNTNSAANARVWIARHKGNQIINGYDKVLLSEGDTIVLYHVPDILSSWNYTRLYSDKLSASAGESIEIFLEQTSCTFRNGVIIESGFVPVANAPVYAGDVWYTSPQGNVLIIPDGDFPLVVWSGNDALLISEILAVSAGFPSYVFRLHPNPVKDHLFISGKNSANYDNGRYRIKLIGSAGTVLRENEISSLPGYLNLSSFAPGVYQLVIMDGRNIEIHKIIKQ